tara:strand:+ start:2636 stop:2887 length:252 start_codon:yes stop_codon:yes gene_type:complete
VHIPSLSGQQRKGVQNQSIRKVPQEIRKVTREIRKVPQEIRKVPKEIRKVSQEKGFHLWAENRYQFLEKYDARADKIYLTHLA